MIDLTYKIGEGLLTQNLPPVQQEPDCGFLFTEFRLEMQASNITADALSQIVTLS